MIVLSLSLKLKNQNETEADEVGIRVGYELMGDDGTTSSLFNRDGTINSLVQPG